MATKYLSKITLLDGTQVEIKDAVARQAIQGGTHFRGVTTTALTDGASTSTIVIGGENYSAQNGDIVVNGNKEFIYADADSKWHELGDVTNLGALALKDSASGSYTPAGSVSFTGSSTTSTGKFTPEGSVSFTGGTVNSTGSYTPAGSVSFTGGTVNSTGSYTPAGSVSKPDVDVTPTTASISEFDSAGSVTAGTAASFSATYDESNENLTLAFTANTPTAVTLPTSKSTTVMTGAAAELHEAPAFTGTAATLEVSGTAAGSASFTGTEATLEVSGTAAGSATFTGSEGDVSVTGTPEGSATFTGTAATITVS